MCRKALELASRSRLQKEISSIIKDFQSSGGTSILDRITHQNPSSRHAQGENQQFLCILDQDMLDESEDPNEDDKVQHTSTLAPERPANIGKVPKLSMNTSTTSEEPAKILAKRRHEEPLKNAKYIQEPLRDLLPPKDPIKGPFGNKAQRESTTHDIEWKHADIEKINSTKNNSLERKIPSPVQGHNEEQEEILIESVPEQLPPDRQPGHPVPQKLPEKSLLESHIPVEETRGYSIDEFVWNGLCLRALSAVESVRTLYKFHPLTQECRDPIIDPEADIALYQSTVRFFISVSTTLCMNLTELARLHFSCSMTMLRNIFAPFCIMLNALRGKMSFYNFAHSISVIRM